MGIKYIWYKDLYVGEKASKNTKALIKKLENGKFKPDIFLITLPDYESGNMLDIYRAAELKQPVYNDRCKYVVGLAKGKDEAIDIVAELVDSMHKSGTGFDIRSFLNFREM